MAYAANIFPGCAMGDTVFLKDNKLTDVTVIDNAFIRDLMPSAPELALKAYLYGLMRLSSGRGDGTDAAAALGCTKADLLAAFAYWQGVGVVTVIAEEPLQVRYESLDNAMLGLAHSSGRYADLVKRLQAALGTRQLTGRELSKIYDWVEKFGLDQDAAVLIVRRCLEKKGARVSVTYMDSAAIKLHNMGALTLEQVEEAFREEDKLNTGAAHILQRWHRHRPPTDDELALYEKWTEGWGFDEFAISTACEQMVSAEKPTFSYLDSILTEWHSNGRITSQQIRDMQRQDDSIREIARQAFSRAGIKSAPSREQRLCVKEWTVDLCMSPELVYLAAEYAKGRTHQFAHMRSVLNEWHEKGISSITAAKSYYEAYQKNAPSGGRSGKKNPALNYKQGGAYTREELKKLGINMGEEFYTDD